MKVKRMGITEILRRIWLFSANKIKSSESFSKQPTQLIFAAHNCHTLMSFFSLWFHDFFSQLNAGSCDRVIRVWELHTGSPVAVLTKHTGTVTAINFCPFLLNDDGSRFLASTSGDGTVSFWRYHYDEHGHTNFDAQPTRYHEKSRPGNAQMICASYSPVWIFR